MPVDFLCADFNRLSLLIGHFDGSNPAQRAMLVHELAGIHKQNCLQCRELRIGECAVSFTQREFL